MIPIGAAFHMCRPAREMASNAVTAGDDSAVLAEDRSERPSCLTDAQDGSGRAVCNIPRAVAGRLDSGVRLSAALAVPGRREPVEDQEETPRQCVDMKE
jgi:hypothetical protein